MRAWSYDMRRFYLWSHFTSLLADIRELRITMATPKTTSISKSFFFTFESLCFVRKGASGPGEREKRQRAGNAGREKERRKASRALSLFPSFPARPSNPIYNPSNLFARARLV